MQQIIAILLIFSSSVYLSPMFISIIYGDGAFGSFAISFSASLAIGALILKKNKPLKIHFNNRISAILVFSLWSILSFLVTLPLFLGTSMTFVDAFFEAVSGLTTTGATVVEDLNQLPISILFYRQFLQWIGGIGVVLLVVAILPFFGSRGAQLYRMEITGIQKDHKLTPKIAGTAKILLFVYLMLTVASTLAYWWAGMSWFDAISHSFSTVSIGGFSTHNENFGFFQNQTIEIIAVVFMVISGINFGLHFLFLYTGRFRFYMRDVEFRYYMSILLFSALIVFAMFYFGKIASHDVWNFIFQGISVITTTGFTLNSLNEYPIFFQSFWFILSCIGGSAGSVSGGIKVIRFLLMFRHVIQEIKRFLHPNIIMAFKINNNHFSYQAIFSLWGFVGLYLFLLCTGYLLLVLAGLSPQTAISATLASLNNLGPGLGGVVLHYADLNDFVKLILTFLMLLGRLELMVVFSLLMFRSW